MRPTYDMTPEFKRLNKNIIDSNTKHLKGFAIGQEKLTIITKRQKKMIVAVNAIYAIV